MMEETISNNVCYTPPEYYAFLNDITQGTIRFGAICIVIGYLAGRFTPIVITKAKEWYRGRTSE